MEDIHTLPDSEKELRYGKIPRLFRKFAIPGVIGIMFMGIQAIIDGIMLGNYVNANALASVSLTLPAYSFITAIGIVVSVGCQTVISISLGERNRQRANDAMVSALLFIISFATIIATLTYIYAHEIATFLGANDVLLQGSIDYIRSLLPFLPMLVTLFFCDYTLKALGHPVYSMVVMTGTVMVNIILDIVFIGMMDMEVTGAGLATGIAFTLGVVFSLPIILKEREKVNIFKGKFNINLLGRMFYNGSSEGIAELSAGITIFLFNITMMKHLGEVGVAAYTSLEYILFVFITVFLGVSNGIIPIVSYNYGANQWDRIKKVLKLAAKTNLVIGIALFLTLTLFGEEIVGLFFSSGETEILKIASQGTVIYAFAFLFNGLNILASSYFTAIANAKVSVIISLLRGVVLIVPGIIFLPMLIGIEGVWLAIPIAETVTFIVSVILVKNSITKMRKTKLMQK